MKGKSRRPVFKKGDRVRWIETGEKGIVSSLFIDGYVSLTLDDGSPAELDSESLEKIETKQKRKKR